MKNEMKCMKNSCWGSVCVLSVIQITQRELTHIVLTPA